VSAAQLQAAGDVHHWYRENTKWVSDVRAGEYLSYYEKYYEDRDNSPSAIAGSGSKLSA
jgi:hypothetical protein